MRLDRVDRWLGASLVLVALAWLALAYMSIPASPAPGDPGPRTFPLLLGLLLAVLGALLAARSRPNTRPDDAETIPPVTRREIAMAAGTVALLLAYAFLLDKAGFLLATPIVMGLAMFGLLGLRRYLRVAAFVAAFTAGCWVVFAALLGTPLPGGSWLGW